MSISSEITRIANKRDASFTAVANKGVTVPSGSTIDDLPGLISSISTGGSVYSVSTTLTNVTSNNNDTEVLQGGSFFADLTPANGTAITNVVVTMGGVDITSQVFSPGVGTKSIASNGTYTAASDSLSGYSQVSVNVQNSYSASDNGKVVSNGALVSQTSATYTTNNTYDTTTVNSVTVNVSGGVTPTGTKQISITSNGTTTEDVTNYASVEITTNVSASGSDLFVAPGGTNYTSISSTNRLVYDVSSYKTRRSVWKNTGTMSAYYYRTSSDYNSFSGLYPLEIPSGATKVSISADGPAQGSYMTLSYSNNNYTQLQNPGWMSLPISNATIQSGAQYLTVNFRANTSNENFTSSTQPRNISVSFE